MVGLILNLASVFAVFSAGWAEPLKTRIIAGTPVPSGALPWQVILKKDASDSLLCGGSVIAPDWVLTAAHCTYGLQSIYLIFGTNRLNAFNVSMTSTELLLHPEYNPANLNNDVSLIKLPNSLIYTNTIQPINLVPSSQSSNSFIGTTAIIAGFGYTDDEDLEFSNTLLSATVQIIQNAVCVVEFGSDIVIQSTMCAEGINGGLQSICSGDSGGPLIIKDSNELFMQIGINSFVAYEACTEGHPSGYARLTSFLTYIEQTTGLDFS